MHNIDNKVDSWINRWNLLPFVWCVWLVVSVLMRFPFVGLDPLGFTSYPQVWGTIRSHAAKQIATVSSWLGTSIAVDEVDEVIDHSPWQKKNCSTCLFFDLVGESWTTNISRWLWSGQEPGSGIEDGCSFLPIESHLSLRCMVRRFLPHRRWWSWWRDVKLVNFCIKSVLDMQDVSPTGS